MPAIPAPASSAPASAGRRRPGPRRLADRLDPQRARHLQPLRARAAARPPSTRSTRADPRAARPRQPRHRRRRALAGRKMDRLAPTAAPITLTLRDGITFSDGAPFTSDDVVFTFQALYDPAVDSALATGAVRSTASRCGHRAPIARTVVMHDAGAVRAGHRAARQRADPARSTSSRRRSTRTPSPRRGASTTPPGQMAGLGPFMVAEYVPGQRMTFARNPHYWQEGRRRRRRCRTSIGWSIEFVKATRTPRSCACRPARST